MSESEIVDILTDHSDALIQDTLSIQNITTISGFKQLLQQEDIWLRINWPGPEIQPIIPNNTTQGELEIWHTTWTIPEKRTI